MADKIEHISESDVLNAEREKINKFAIDPALRAEQNSLTAKNVANQSQQISTDAKDIAKNTDGRLDNIVAGEMQDAEVIDARKPFGAETYETLSKRLDEQIGLNKDFREFETDKFSFMRRVKNEFFDRGINPEWYTSTTNDDTQKLQLAINNAIKFEKDLILTKDYEIDTVAINQGLTIRGNGHTLTANHTATEKCVDINMPDGVPNEKKTVTIFSLNVVNKSNYKYGIYNDSGELNIHQCSVKGFSEANVVGKPNSGESYGNVNIYFLRSELSKNGFLSLGATDHKINHFYGFNCMTHLNGMGGNSYVFDAHGWNYNIQDTNWINGSCFVRISNSCTLVNIYADTLETAIDLTSANTSNWALVSITNLGYFINRSTYPNQTASNGVPTPKIFTNLDDFKGQLSVSGLNIDFVGWLDKDGNWPRIAEGNIDTTRMKFSGLNANGADDSQAINIKISRVIDEHISYSDEYLQPYDFKMMTQLGKTYINIPFSLKKQIPANALIGDLTIKSDVIKLSDVSFINFAGIGLNSDGKSYPISGNVTGNKITMTNSSGVALNSGLKVTIDITSFLS